MLIEFTFTNYRSFRDETVLSMEAAGLRSLKNSLIRLNSKTSLVPSAAIFGKNGGGKSNVIRAFWLAVQFIRNAQVTQHADDKVPVHPFLLNDYSASEPTAFNFVYTFQGIKYWYSFAATEERIVSESLYHAPNGQKALVFQRDGQKYKFTSAKSRRKLIAEVVAENQLYFSVASMMNDEDCISAMTWFRDCVVFSRDYADMPTQLVKFAEDQTMLNAIRTYAKSADVGIEDMQFEINSREIPVEKLPEEMPKGLGQALAQLMETLTSSNVRSAAKFSRNEVKTTSMHQGINRSGERQTYPLGLDDESDGTRRLMSLAPGIESALNNGGLFLIDEIDRGLHPLLVKFFVSRFQSKETNKNGAQLIFTTHDIELLNLEILRKDQLYFVDKDQADGASSLYSISDFVTKTSENIQKGYLVGKYGGIPELDMAEVD